MSKTEENLKAALAGEAQARAKYKKWAGAAKKEGHQAIAQIFEETAENEYEHAAMIMKLMGVVGTTEENLKAAFDGETYEWTQMYPKFLEDAKAEGNMEAAKYFEHVIVSEKHHARRYRLLLERLKSKTLYTSDNAERWFCTNCGYIHEGNEAPEECPNCLHKQGYFKRICDIEYEG